MRIAGITSRQASARIGAQVRENRTSRALVAVTPATPASRAAYDRPRAVAQPACFLAHLVAMRDQAPQTRERRRADPAEAVRVYRAQTMTAPVNGQQMSRLV